MRHIFDADTLRARLRDYNVVVFQIASSLVKSGVLALAAIPLRPTPPSPPHRTAVRNVSRFTKQKRAAQTSSPW